MRIGKRIFSVIIAACIMVTTVSVDIPLVSSASETEELMAADGTMALAGDENNITVSGITTASTYYSAYGVQHPMYIEYTTTSTLTNEQRNYVQLEITKEDGTNVCTQPSDITLNSFSIIDCIDVENGNTYNLIFTITYNKPGEEKKLWSEKRTVSFEEKKEWASCNYFPTGKNYFDCELYIPKDKITGSNMVDEVYLFDEDGNIAAKSVRTEQLLEVNYVAGSEEDPRYRGIFSNTPAFIEDMDMYRGYCSFYRTRKLKEDEKLYVGYNLNGTIYKLEDIVLIVTSKPYITFISYLPRDFQGNLYYDQIGIDDIYAGADNASVIDLSAYNTDFSKLSFELQDKDTKETAGVSTAYMQLTRNYALYNIQWKDGKEPKGLSSYNVVYNYNGSGTGFVTDGSALSCYTSSRSENIIWNSMEDSIEYYNKDMPAGSLVSYEVKNSNSSTAVTYASGECTVNNNHLITVPLQEISSAIGSCYLTVIYTDSEGIRKTAEPRSVGVDTSKTGAFIYSCYLTKQAYLPADGDIEFSIAIHCKDKSKLPDKCIAYIYNNAGGNTAETELMLENENGRLVYKGTCTGLDAGAYQLSFTPYGENQLRFSFFVLESNRLCLKNQSNNLDSGKISIYFISTETAEWYCGEENSKIQDNLRVKILDTQENEIGTYTHKDFIITGEDFYRDIQFTEDVMKQLAGINYCYVYLYYGDGNEEDTIAIYSYDPGSNNFNNFYDKELLYENGVYVSGDKENGWLWLGIPGSYVWTDEWIIYPGFLYGKFNSIYGTKGTFPAVITITDWYSMEVIKKITVNEPGHIFTESELEGLSPTKLYYCYLQGADGSVDEHLCYLGEYDIVPDDKEEENNPGTGDNKNEEDNNGGEDNKTDEEDKTDGDKTDNDKTDNEDKTDKDTGNDNPEIPETRPTKAPNVWYGWVNTSGENTSIEPTIKPEETPSPSQTPEPSPSPVPTPKATIKPEVTSTPENTPEPMPTIQPEASAPPLDNKEPDKADNLKWNTVDSINKWELSLKKKKIKLKKGQKAKIKITSELNTKVVYKSLKPSVATVNKNGVVTAKKAGKAVITVKANGKVCKVTVTVTAKETVKENIKIPAGASIVKLNKDFKLTETKATIKKGKKLVIQKADGIQGKVTFISLDKKIASVSVNGVIKAKKKGKTVILIKKGKKTIKLKITVKK